jgi:F-type H+-transporting ATPase subunit b
MLIDWFTVGAQVLNFVLLVWLMKRFLYRPVLNAIAAREKRIADQIADAEAKEAQAEVERKAFQAKNADFDAGRADLLAQATADSLAAGQRILDDAHQAADEQAAKREQALNTEAAHLSQMIGSRAREEVFAIARKALADLASATLEERIGEVFVRRLGELTEPAKARLAAALKAASEPARLRSAFELPAGPRQLIQDALSETFSTAVPLHFETASDLVCGIELSVGGEKLAWTIAEYLKAFEEGVADVIATRGKADSLKAAVPVANHPASRNANKPAAEPTSSAA